MDQDKVNDRPSVAEEFWAALATNDRDRAQQVVDRLALPPVETSAFSLEEVEGELQQVRGEEGGDGGSGLKHLPGLKPWTRSMRFCHPLVCLLRRHGRGF
jgi:hypothetical protein